MVNEHRQQSNRNSNTLADKSEAPDLGKAAKDFWAAMTAKARDLGDAAMDLGGKAAEAAKDLETKASDKAKAPRTATQQLQKTARVNADLLNVIKVKAVDIWRRAPTVVVVSGISLVVLCSFCFICTALLSSIVGNSHHVTEESGRRSSEAAGKKKPQVEGSERRATVEVQSITVEVKTVNSIETAAHKASEAVYRTAKKHPESKKIVVTMKVFAPGGFFDKYGNRAGESRWGGSALEMGSFTVTDADEVRKYKDEIAYSITNEAWYLIQIKSLENTEHLDR